MTYDVGNPNPDLGEAQNCISVISMWSFYWWKNAVLTASGK